MCPFRNILLLSTASLLFLLIAGSQSELFSQNVVANGQFDADISAWSQVSGFGSAGWDQVDANGFSHSGSLFLVNSAIPESQNTSVSQCQPVTGGVSYDFSADIRPDNFCCIVASPSDVRDTLHTGFLYALLNFYSQPSCGGAPLADFARLDSAGQNVWQSLAQTVSAPASAASASITLAIFKNERGDTLTGHFDDILLAPAGTTRMRVVRPARTRGAVR